MAVSLRVKGGRLLEYPSPQAIFDHAQTYPFLGVQQDLWVARTRHYCDRLSPLTQLGCYPRILIAQSDPIDYLAGFMAACVEGCPIFLGNPHWSLQEWQQVLAMVQPHQVWGTLPVPVTVAPPETADPQTKGWIMIPTSGSSGQMRFAIHTWETLTASVQGVQAFFEVAVVHSCCVLPLYHVSGLMQFLRSLLTQGTLLLPPFGDLLSEPPSLSAFLALNSPYPQAHFLSLVPTQLYRLCQQPQCLATLRQFSAVLLGGAPAWRGLLDLARQLELPLAPTYGMTETASQIATLKPAAFLQGETGVGQVLPHAQVQWQPEPARSSEQPLGQRLLVRAASLFEGYYPHHNPQTVFVTGDRGYVDPQGNLHIQGRSSRTIISGGENIAPEEIEAALYATGLVQDVYVLGLPDAEWGEAVVAIYVAAEPLELSDLKQRLKPYLSAYKIPKRWLKVSQMGRNAQGKIDCLWLQQTLASF